jgi:hypothetical protein
MRPWRPLRPSSGTPRAPPRSLRRHRHGPAHSTHPAPWAHVLHRRAACRGSRNLRAPQASPASATRALHPSGLLRRSEPTACRAAAPSPPPALLARHDRSARNDRRPGGPGRVAAGAAARAPSGGGLLGTAARVAEPAGADDGRGSLGGWRCGRPGRPARGRAASRALLGLPAARRARGGAPRCPCARSHRRGGARAAACRGPAHEDEAAREVEPSEAPAGARRKASTFWEELALHEWVKNLNQGAGVAPSCGQVWARRQRERRRGAEAAAGHDGAEAMHPRYRRQWVRRWRRRWRVGRRQPPSGPGLARGALESKAGGNPFWGEPKS